MTHKWLGEGGKEDTNAPKSRNHNQHERGAQLITTEWVGEGSGHRAPGGSLVKPPFQNLLEGEG